MPRTRRTLRQRHFNLSRQYPNELDFLNAVGNFDAANLRRRNQQVFFFDYFYLKFMIFNL